MGLDIKRRILKWLLKGVLIEGIRVKRLRVGSTITITSDYIDMQPLTSDPPLAQGRVWFRGDLGSLRYSPDGNTVYSLDPPVLDLDYGAPDIPANSSIVFQPAEGEIWRLTHSIGGDGIVLRIWDGSTAVLSVNHGAGAFGYTLAGIECFTLETASDQRVLRDLYFNNHWYLEIFNTLSVQISYKYGMVRIK